MKYFTNVEHEIRHYVGTDKISAIKAVRMVLGVTLKEAKDLVEWQGGFAAPNYLWNCIQHEYNTFRKSLAERPGVSLQELERCKYDQDGNNFQFVPRLPPAIMMS
jgi:hypothetical protein